jgi:pimeloyl-ACP methyl ester carboxylesterase
MRTDPQRGAELLHAATRAGPKRGYYYQLLSTFGWSSLPALPLLRQPTLILAGDDDPIIPVVNARVMARLIPDSRLHIYSGGHLGIITESDQLAPIVEEFLGP